MNREAILLERWSRGDEDAFNTLLREHIPGAERLALKLTKDPNLAEDIVSEMLIRVFRAADRFRGGAQFKTWLHRIVVNCVLDARRKRSFLTTSLDELHAEEDGSLVSMQLADDALDPLEALLQAEDLDAIERSVDDLVGEQRNLIYLFHKKEMGYHEISDSLHVPIGTVKSRLHRARQTVKDHIEKEERHARRESRFIHPSLRAS